VIKVTGVPGIPLALAAGEGAYYLPFEALRGGRPCPVLLQEPGDRTPTEVAASADEFARFEPVPPSDEN
jgi:hypothetical protein